MKIILSQDTPAGTYDVTNILRAATNRTSAQAAWAKFGQYNRINYATNPKYNKVPRAA